MMHHVFSLLRRLSGLSHSTLILSVLLLGSFQPSVAQKTSRNNFIGNWEQGSSWVGGVSPAVTNIGSADLDLTINGYITRTGNLSFTNVNANASGPDLVINDTLVVVGDVTFANKAANLILSANSILIISGNFTANNKITVENGGVFVVTGDMTFSNSGQDNYDDSGGGSLYVGGAVDGNPDAEPGETNWDNLDEDFPDITDFIGCVGSGCLLPIKLLSFSAELAGDVAMLRWATFMEENFQKFVVERSADGFEFEAIGEVFGQGRNIYELETRYTFEDWNPHIGWNYYRLKAVDVDLKFEYSKIVSLHMEQPKTMWVSPNPASGRITYFKNFGDAEGDRVVLLDQLGKPVLDYTAYETHDGIPLTSDVTPGLYFLRYVSGDREYMTRVVIR